MADHGKAEYATATGNDYPEHENTYGRFVQLTFVGALHVITILLGLTTGGVLGHWGWAAAIFVIGTLGAIPGLVGTSKTSSYVSFTICFLIFAFTALSSP